MMSSHIALTKPVGENTAEHTLPSLRWRSRAGLVAIILVLMVGSGMIAGYVSTQRQVTIIVNEYPLTTHTHQTSVAALLDELGISLAPEDIIMAPLDAPLEDNEPIIVHKALPVSIEVDGRMLELRTHTHTLADLLREAGIAVNRYDQIIVAGEDADLETRLPLDAPPNPEGANPHPHPDELWHQHPLRVVVRRAVPITIHDGPVPISVQTTGGTVGQSLFDEGIILYLGDGVSPSLGTEVSAGTQVYIKRSKPIVILADGRRVKTRSQEETVEAALSQESIELVDKDYTIPDRQSEVYEDMTIRVVRVQEQVVLEEEPIPFETLWQPDDTLELDNQRLDQTGAAGLKRRLVRVVFENGVETERVTEEERVETPPTTEIIAYGTKIVLREQVTRDGTITYWRKLRAYATAYTASTAGTPHDAPWFGRTYTGHPARKGIIAVDPEVISFGTRMYVPGYGFGLAADKGVHGKHIDLCYDDDKWPPPWHWWVDVYLLTPVPPPERIRWILPSYPRER